MADKFKPRLINFFMNNKYLILKLIGNLIIELMIQPTYIYIFVGKYIFVIIYSYMSSSFDLNLQRLPVIQYLFVSHCKQIIS